MNIIAFQYIFNALFIAQCSYMYESKKTFPPFQTRFSPRSLSSWLLFMVDFFFLSFIQFFSAFLWAGWINEINFIREGQVVFHLTIVLCSLEMNKIYSIIMGYHIYWRLVFCVHFSFSFSWKQCNSVGIVNKGRFSLLTQIILFVQKQQGKHGLIFRS